MDCEVFAFLEQERSEGRAVLNNDLSQKAVQVAEHLGLRGFLASKMWLQRWKRRWNVGYRRGTNTSQKVPDDYKDQLTHSVDQSSGTENCTPIGSQTLQIWIKQCAGMFTLYIQNILLRI